MTLEEVKGTCKSREEYDRLQSLINAERWHTPHWAELKKQQVELWG
jgi:hypothetical protein